MNLSPPNHSATRLTPDPKWLPVVALLGLVGLLCALIGLGSLLWLRHTLYPGAAFQASQGLTLTTQGGWPTGSILLISRNLFVAEATTGPDVARWYRAQGWTPRFRPNMSNGTAYLNTYTLSIGPVRLIWQTRVTILSDTSPPNLLVHIYLTIVW